MIRSCIRLAVAVATVGFWFGCDGSTAGPSGGDGGTAGIGGAPGTGGGAGAGGRAGTGGDAGAGGSAGGGGAAGEGGAGGAVPGRQWGTPEMIDAGDEDASGPQVAFDSSGNAVAVWFQSDGFNGRIWARWYVPGQAWGAPETISPAMVTSAVPRVGADPNGDAIAVWRQQSSGRFSAWSNRYTPSFGWGTAEPIGAADTSAGDFGIAVAVGTDGNAISVWHQGDGMRSNVWANRYTPGSGWGTAEIIESENGGDAKNAQVAIDGNGNAIAVWAQNDGMDNYIAASRYTPGGGWAPDESIDSSPGISSRPQVESDPLGNAMAVWAGIGMRANRYAEGTGWGTDEDIRSDPMGSVNGPNVTVGVNGDAIALWPQLDTTPNNMWANRYVPGGGWGTAEIIENDDAGGVQWPDVAMDPAGNAVAVWEQSDGARTNIWANQYTVGGGWGNAEIIDTEDLGDAEFPKVAIDSDGNAMAVWYQSNGTRLNVWANRFE